MLNQSPLSTLACDTRFCYTFQAMLTIRLQRTGTKNRANFRIVLAEAHRAAGKKVLEVLGHYNPRSKDFGIKDKEKLNYWLSQKVQVSPSAHNLLVEKQIVTGKKVKAWQPKKKEKETKVEALAAAAPSEDGASLAPKEREIPAAEQLKSETKEV